MRVSELSVGSALVDQLRRFRRRLIAVHLVEQMAVAATATCAVWSAAVLIAAPAPSRAVLWLVLAGVVAVASTVCHTLLQPWSLATTAVIVDRRFHLDERVTTALACMDDGDAVSPLIVADAGRHLQACSRRDIRPVWRIDARLLAASVAVALIASAVAVGRGPGDDPDRAVRAGDSSTTRESEDAGSRAATRRQSSGSPAVASPPRGSQATSPSTEPGGRTPTMGRSGATSDHIDEPRNGGQDARTAAGSASARAEARAFDTTRTPEGTSQASGSGSSESRTAGGNADAGDRGRANSGGAAGGGPTSGSSARGGGVQDAPRLAVAAQRGAPSDTNASVAERYRAALQAAESPVAQERIPEDLRGYVRDYFLAMRPAQGRGDER